VEIPLKKFFSTIKMSFSLEEPTTRMLKNEAKEEEQKKFLTTVLL